MASCTLATGDPPLAGNSVVHDLPAGSGSLTSRSAECSGHAAAHRPAVEQQHLGQVVRVGLSGPGAGADLAGRGELVVPVAGRRVGAALLAVPPPASRELPVPLLAGN